MSATVETNSPQIRLSWPVDPYATEYLVYRKSRDTTNWGTATKIGSNNAYLDTNVLVGSSYEYWIHKTAYETNSITPYNGDGYILAGIEMPLVENRGKVLLLVDHTMTNALASEIARLQLDLTGDGWTVVRRDVLRTATPVAIKAVVTNEYFAQPEALQAVFILGHVPVPYSGLLAPDGHSDHYGAWPADQYYADVDGLWTDTTVSNVAASRVENRNVPGDGKFDQSKAPTDLELQLGRVDLWNMPAFPLSETELLRQYLNKDHGFRMRYINPRRRALLDDSMNLSTLAAVAYRNFAPMFGSTNMATGRWFATLASNSYLFGHATGYGSYTSESGVGTTTSFVRTNTQVIFTTHFGSYFGDYDSQNNLMRAQLANGGSALTCAWSEAPDWQFHHMALGEPIGFSARMTENFAGSVYKGYRSVHVNLLGDPTLRLHIVAPPSALRISGVSGARNLSWRPSPDAVLGYHVYGATDLAGPFTRLNSALLTTTNFTDSSASSVYIVRAVVLEQSPSGSYFNASQGIFENVTGTLTPPSLRLAQPTNGASFPLGTPITLAAMVSDANNDLVRIEYRTNGVLLATVTNAPYAWTWNSAALGTYAVTAVARDSANLATTSAVANIAVTYSLTSLVPTGSVWKYEDTGTDLGTAWRAPDFDDSSWPSGPAQLGFGDGDERTLIVSNRLRITTYFRKSFVMPTNANFLGLSTRLLRDDGGVVYLNGSEVFRSNMPTNPILWSTWASAAALTPDESTQFYSSAVNLGLLQPGTNWLAVEIHQNGTNSSDLTFDLELVATNVPPGPNRAPAIAWSNITSGAILSSANATLSVSATDPDENLELVQYFADGSFIGESANAPFAFTWSNGVPGYHRLEAVAFDGGGLTASTSNFFVTLLGTPTQFVGSGTIWKFWDRGQQPAGGWNSIGFDDSSWSSGPSPLGYGDANGVWPATTNSFGPNASNRYITTYYRSAFVLTNVSGLTNFTVEVQRDDGLLVYLNGTELKRWNLPATSVGYGTLATATVSTNDEVAWYSAPVNPTLLIPGTNVFAAEVHQVNSTSSDIFFNLRFTAEPIVTPPALTASQSEGALVFSWPSWAAGLSLWSATNLGPETVWAPVTNEMHWAEDHVEIVVPGDLIPARYFRLRGN